MDKKIAEEFVEKYVDGSLSRDEAKEFERCMEQEPSIKKAVEHAKLVSIALPKMRDDTPGEGYWQSYWTRLSRKIYGQRIGLRFGWRRAAVSATAIICIAVLLVVALFYRAQAIRLSVSDIKPGDEFSQYFGSLDNLQKDRKIFKLLESTYPGQIAWFARNKGEVRLGLTGLSQSSAEQTGRLLGIESILLRTDRTGDVSIVLRPRIAALEGKPTIVEFPAGTGDSAAIISASLDIENGKANGPISLTWKTQYGEASASSGNVSLALNKPSRILSLTLDGAEYALLVRPTILTEN